MNRKHVAYPKSTEAKSAYKYFSTKQLLDFADSIAIDVNNAAGTELHCYDAYVVDYNRIVIDFKDYETDEDYSLSIEVDMDLIDSPDDLISNYEDAAVAELESLVLDTPVLSSQSTQNSIKGTQTMYEYDSVSETFEIDMDGVIIIVGQDGDYDYDDQEYTWCPQTLDSEEIPGLEIGSDIGYDIVEYIDELFADVNMEPGKYKLKGRALLTFDISNVFENRNYFKDEDGDILYDSEGIYTDDAEISFDKDASKLDIEFIEI